MLEGFRSYLGSVIGGYAAYKSYQIGRSSAFIAPERSRPVVLEDEHLVMVHGLMSDRST